ncbi:hypothetical protein CEXT_594411 [Caerostris extrusa]|uniref:Uncharacterized protein n=1 Tax=Caerostris extrusa TaxID=172846 RepID=A0AAV4UX80_CAEEX|nr:hypothetical protein CEXT_594411 [Caerostris extrusa]
MCQKERSQREDQEEEKPARSSLWSDNISIQNFLFQKARHFPWAFSPKASVKRPQANPFITGARFERAILRNGEGYLNDCPVPCPFVEKVVRREAI